MLWTARFVLAAVYLAAGLLKVRHAADTRAAATAFGFGRRSASLIAATLPIIEILIAVTLASAAYRSAAIASTVLSAAFIGVIVRSMAQGRRPVCRCFGQLSNRPVGPLTLFRNGLLLAASTALAVAGSSTSWPRPTLAWGVAVLAVFVVILTAVIVALMRQQGRMLTQLETLANRLASEPSSGKKVLTPFRRQFSLPDRQGMTWTLDTLCRKRGALMLFVDKWCPTCHESVGEFLAQEVDGRRWVLIDQYADGQWDALPPGGQILIDEGTRVAHQYGVDVVPCLVVVDPDGWVRRDPAVGQAAIRRLITELPPAAEGVPHADSIVGSPA